MQPEVITFGESMGLFMPTGQKGIANSSQFEKSFGGAETNLAIGISRLGHQVGWFGHLGDEPIGHYIFKVLRGEGIDVSEVKFHEDANTGFMIREFISGKSSVYYYRKNSAASLMKPEDLNESYIKNAKILHVTGITPALSDSCRETVAKAIDIAKSHGVKVCFDPNLRLKLWDIEQARPVLLDFAQKADIFLPGLDELELLYETDDFNTILNHLKELPCPSIIKGGDNKTYVFQDGNLTSVPYFKIDQIVDTVGAGDGFCAGFITGLLENKTLEESVKLGNLIGSMVIQSHGDWEALPTKRQVEQALGITNHIER
ncbi:sugar kinase [Scopulibacillus cellulosilyticus]|uniref:Sugar kinase n=1 Tax=Scopulibacillus cellulosilyticus TaxID=2665665 RepID=A0ABW2Q116_9BACL